jgi:hypothetical protein
MFHGLDKEIGTMIFETAMKDAPTTLRKNSEEIERLNKVHREKEELIAKSRLESANEDYIHAVYYLSMYTSLACWKGDKRVVTKELGKLSSESAKYHALKENILIRVKGCGWEWAKHQWSKNGRKYTIKELTDHLRLSSRKRKGMTSHPSHRLISPQRVSLPVLGTQTSNVASLDETYVANVDELKKRAERIRWKRESKGQGAVCTLSRNHSADLILMIW